MSSHKTVVLDTVNRRLALIAAIHDRIEKLVPLVENCPADNPNFAKMFGGEIADLRLILEDIRYA